MKLISIVVPMRNEGQHIFRTLKSAADAACEAGLKYELIVVDNGSDDNSLEEACRAGARVLVKTEVRVGELRNQGAAVANGDYLAFLDADIEVPRNWLSIALERLEQGSDVVALDCDTPAQAPWFARVWQYRSMSQDGRDRKRSWLPTPNLVMTAETFTDSGGFNSELGSGEDKEFGLRLQAMGKNQISLSKPLAWHWGYEASWSEWVGKEFWRQGSHAQLFRQKTGLRQLRFPLLCMLSTLLLLVAAILLVAGSWKQGLLTLLFSLLPGAALALRQSSLTRKPGNTLRLVFLHWLRLHIGTAAVFRSLF